MRGSFLLGVSVIAALSFAAAAPARAETAERCSWRGCAYIHCNWTGDRCYRIDERGRYCGYYGEGCGYGYSYDDGYRYRYGDREYRRRGGYDDGYGRYRQYDGRAYDDGRDRYDDQDDD